MTNRIRYVGLTLGLACVAVLAACGSRVPGVSTQAPATGGPATPDTTGSVTRPISITLVEVLTGESFPPQLFVHVTGQAPGGECWDMPSDPVPQRAGTAITITITSTSTGQACTMAPWIYDHTFALGSEFGTGDYTLRVNDVERPFHFESGIGP